MSKLLGILLLITAGIFFVKDTPVIQFDDIGMAEVFKNDKLAAKQAAAYFYSMADTIDWDRHNDKGRIKSDTDVVDYRIEALNFVTKGRGFESKYPGFGSKVGVYLDSKVGTVATDNFDEARQAAWVHAWRALGDSCAAAGKGW